VVHDATVEEALILLSQRYEIVYQQTAFS
jgi:hypothetical protein